MLGVDRQGVGWGRQCMDLRIRSVESTGGPLEDKVTDRYSQW
jgi:hypothetical protein